MSRTNSAAKRTTRPAALKISAAEGLHDNEEREAVTDEFERATADDEPFYPPFDAAIHDDYLLDEDEADVADTGSDDQIAHLREIAAGDERYDAR